MKKYLLNLISRKKEEMKKLQERSDASQDIAEVRAIGAQLEAIKAEIAEAEAQLAELERSEVPFHIITFRSTLVNTLENSRRLWKLHP